MKRVVMLTNHDGYTYNFRKEIIHALIETGYEVYLLMPFGNKVKLLKAMGCKYINIPVDRRGTNIVTDLKLLIKYFYYLKKIKPDVVLSYTIKPNVYGGLVCRFLKIPQIANVTGMGTSMDNIGTVQKLTVAMYKIGLKKAACLFFQNSYNMQFFQKMNIRGLSNVLIPGSGINLHEFKRMPYPKDSGVVRFLFIGRLMEAKGVNELLEAFAKVHEKNASVTLEIVGGCEQGYEYKLDQILTMSHVTYHGQQENVKPFIESAHAIVLPSYHEGTANVLLEAAASGRPLLASNIPGCIETFEEGRGGFGFSPKNVESLVKAVCKFIKLPYVEKEIMGMHAREKVEKEYDRKLVVQAYISQIEKAGVIKK